MKINTYLHTIFVLIGPNKCGKTTFAKNKLIPSLRKHFDNNNNTKIKPNIQYISSDDLRLQFVGDNSNNIQDKNNLVYMETSHHVFELINNYLNYVTQFPINAHFVIVDTKGMNSDFRNNIINIANTNNYNVEFIVFNYNKYDDYLRYSNNKRESSKQVDKFRKITLKELGTTKKHIIKELDVNLEVKIKNLELYKNCHLDNKKKYLIIGDLHECIDELKDLLILVGFSLVNDIIKHTDKTKDIEIVFLGDLIDKGHKTKETIDFIFSNLNNEVIIHFVCGNHDRTIYNLLSGLDKEDNYDKNVLEKYFNSYFVFKEDDELKEKFFKIKSIMMPFFRYVSPDDISRSFYVTHSPCCDIYTGKLDKESINNQIYMHVDRSKDIWLSVFKLISNDSFNFPYVVSGHFAFLNHYNGSKETDGNNMILIDTGCIHGNKLTSVLLGFKIKNPIFRSVNFLNKQQRLEEDLTDPFSNLNDSHNETTSRDIVNDVFNNLSKDQSNRINHLINNKINFISGTISPAPSDWEKNELESLEKGIEYYYNYFKLKNIKMKLSLQPKYMGSRCNIYLFKDNLEKSYMVSRNGFIIQKLTKDVHIKIINKLYQKLESFMTTFKIKLLIIDSELMPWKAIGNNLIKKSFETINYALKSEIDLLMDFGFDDNYNDLLNTFDKSEFSNDAKSLSGKKLHDKYGGSIYQTFKSISSEKNTHIQTSNMKKFSDTYEEQLKIYAGDDEIHIKPFGILKIVFEDDNELIPAIFNENVDSLYIKSGQIEIFNMLKDTEDEQFILEFDKYKDFETCCNDARDYYLKIIQKNMEGIVIKPDRIITEIAPYIKVRNYEYLSLIYGPDYRSPYKYKKMIKEKNIKKKLKTSIKEFNIGLKMLQVKYSDINFKNHELVKYYSQFLYLEDYEKEIDPRL